jgi:hypothetical protein
LVEGASQRVQCFCRPDRVAQIYEKAYPIIACMAKDYLAIMGSSANVERFFSACADVCSQDRSALSAESVERLAVSQAWHRGKVEPPSAWAKAIELVLRQEEEIRNRKRS